MKLNNLLNFSFFLLLLLTFETSAQSCNDPDPCQGKTYTQGAWGAGNGNTASQYLAAHFNTSFPSGISIGCGSRQLILTSTAAIAAFLPSGSTPSCLPGGTLTNPGSSYNNVLAGQLITLMLNAQFDQDDNNFSPSGIALSHYTIASGPFSGMTVGSLITLANSIIGGCSSQYSYSQLNTAIDNINNTYDSGTANTGFLNCGGACNINVNAAYNSISCFGGVTTVSISASGGRSPYTGTGTFTVSAGTHSFLVMDAFGCTAVKTITVSQAAQLLVSANASSIFCFGGLASVTVNAVGGTGPYTGTGTFSRTAGLQTFTVADHNGCIASVTKSISTPAQLIVNGNSGNILCYGGTTTVTISASGGTPPYISGIGTGTSAAGTYSYVVTDSKGCKTAITLTITQPSALIAASTSSTINCAGGSGNVTVTASGGTQPYTGTGTFTRLAGSYSYTVTDSQGCKATSSGTMIQPTPLTASATCSANIACFGGTATVHISANGGTAPYSGTGSHIISAGPYSFTVTDANGCIAIVSGTINQPAQLVASSTGGTIACNGTTTVNVTATGGFVPYTGTGVYTVGSGPYSFTVADANGCLASASGTIAQPAPLTASAMCSANITCFGGTTTVHISANGGTAPYSGTGSHVVSAGPYSFTVTDANGCIAVVNGTINQPAQLIASATTGTINCGGTTTINVTASGGFVPYTGTGVYTVGSGPYSFTVADANGCKALVTDTITQAALLTASATCNANIACFGGTTTVHILASGGTSPYTNTGAHVVSAGPYSFTVTDANGCIAVVNGTINQPAQLVASATNGTITCSGTTTVNVTANGGFVPYTGTGVYTVGSGPYSFTVNDANGCQAIVTGTITQPSPLTASAMCSANIACFGGTTTVHISANGGTAPYSGTGSHVVSAGPYSFTVTDANGCSAVVSGTINQPAQLVASATNGTVACGGTTTVNITATGGFVPYTGTGIYTVGSGPYSFTVADANGCLASVSGTITQPAPLTASAICSANIACFGGTTTVHISANGGTAPYSGTGSHIVSAGPYSFTVTDANGCIAIVSGTINQPAQLIASATTGTISCGGTTTINVTASGGFVPYTGTGVYTVGSGPYSFTVADANGCLASASGTITQPTPLTASGSQGTILCNGETTTVNISAEGGTSPYSGTGTFTVGAGTYTYLVIDANGCSVTATITITQPNQLTASASTGTISGFGGTTTVVITANGGTAPYSGTGTFIASAGTQTYLVTDANGCTTTVTITLTEPGQLVANATAGTILCNGGATTVNVSASGGVAPYAGIGTFTATAGTHTYLVTDANGNSATATVTITEPTQLTILSTQGTILCNDGTTTVNISAEGGTGSYTGTGVFTVGAGTYTYQVTDANGCSTATTVTITQPGQLTASASVGTISGFGGTTTVVITANGGTSPYTGVGTFTASTGTQTYLVADANGCSTTVTVTLTEPGQLVVNATAGTILCNGGTTTVNVSASGGVAPYTGIGTFTASAGPHTYLVTDANSNSTTATITVTEPTQLTASATTGNISGFGGTTTVVISASGGTTPYNGTGTFTAVSGIQTYLVTDANGCSTTVTVTLTEPGQLVVNATAGSILCNGGTTTVNVSASGGVAPYAGIGTFTATAGTHTYLVTDANGNSATATIIIIEPSQLTASALTGTISGFGGTTTVVISANGGTAPYTGVGTFTTASGTHTYLVTDANGCSTTVTVTLTEPGQLVITATAGTILCNGGTTTVNVSASGGIAPYTGTGAFTTTAGTHTYLVTDANGNSVTAMVTITEPTQLAVLSTQGTILCNGGTTTVNISAEGGTGSYTGTGAFTVGAGTYTYQVIDANGCSATTTITITQPIQLTASATTGTISGFGGTTTVVITANGGTAPYSGVGTFTAVSGTHTYLITDANGCTATVTITLTEPGQLLVSATAGTILCNGGTTTVIVSASGGVAPYTGTGTFTTTAGTHTYLVTDANSNNATATVTITEPGQLAASATTGTISSFGGTTTVVISANGGTTPYNGTGTFTATGGTHTYLITDANDCSTTVTVTLTEPAQLVANATVGTILCNGGTTTVNVSASGGVAPYSGTGTFTTTAGTHTYLVTDINGNSTTATITIIEPSQLIVSGTTGTISGFGGTTTVVISANGGTAPYTGTGTFTTTAGTHTYLITDANGCSTTTTVTLTEPDLLVVTATAGTILCNGGTTTVSVSASGGIAPYTGTGTFTTIAGTHTYLVTDISGNSVTATVTITEPSQLTVSAITGTISSFGGTTTVVITANGGTTPYTGTGIFTASAGTHTYLVTDANGCSTTVTVTLTEPGQLVVNATAGTILCNGGTTTVIVSVAGGVAPYSGTGTFTATAGTHTYLVTDANGNSVTATVTITEPTQLTVLSTQGTILCNGGTTTVSISAADATAPYAGTGIFTLTAGTYTYPVTDANGCSATTTLTITEPNQLATSAASGIILCHGEATTVDVSANGGTAPYSGTGVFVATAGSPTYLVTDANGCLATTTIIITQPGQLTASASVGTISGFGGTTTVVITANGGTTPYTGTGIFTAASGTHTYLVIDANGCSTTVTVTLTEPAQLVANATTGTILCNGGTTTVNVSVSGGVAPYFGAGTFTTTAGTHTYLVTDANGNSVTTTVTITEPTQLTASSTTGTISGFGGTTTVVISANGGTTPYNGVGTFTVSAGIYTYLITDTNGCSITVTVTLTQPGQLIANATAGPILCNGGTTTVNVTASGGVAPYSGIGTFTATAGTHSYLVTDANSNTATAIATITQPTQLVVFSTQGNILCHGGTTTVNVSANGGTAPYNGTGTFIAASGTHTYLVTDANGCSTTLTVTLTEPGQFVANATAGSIFCHGGTTTVNVSANGGTVPYSGTGIFTVTAGSYTYQVTDANGCSATTIIIITQPSQLTTSATTGTISGFGGTTTVVISANGGTAPYSGTGTFTAASGTHTYLVTDANGCSFTATVTLTQPGQLIVNATAGPILCNGGTATVNVSAFGGVAPYSGIGTFTAATGTHTYVVTDANSNVAITTVTITEPTQLVIHSTQGNILCNGGTTTATISATGGTAPYTGTGLFSIGAGTYTYVTTDANGCASSTVLNVSQPSPLVINFLSDSILCNGGSASATISATGGVTPYSGAGIVAIFAGTHTFVVTDNAGCSASTVISIGEPPALTLNVISDSIQCNGGTANVSISASGGTAPYSGEGSFQFAAGTHTLIITDASGCSSSTVINIGNPAPLNLSLVRDSILCNGGVASLTIDASGGSAPYSGIGVFPVTAGQQIVVVTDAMGCSAFTVINVTEPSPLQATFVADSILCNGGSTTVTITALGGTAPYSGTGSYTYNTGSYANLVTDANGCIAFATGSITEPEILAVDVIPDSLIRCNGLLTTLRVNASGGTLPYSGTGIYTVAAGTYSYAVTDANGCSTSTTITMTEPDPLIAGSVVNSTITCNGGLANVTVYALGGTVPYLDYVTEDMPCMTDTLRKLLAANGGTVPYTGPGTYLVPAGSYTYGVVDSHCCWDTAQITLTEPPKFVGSVLMGDLACSGGETSFTINATGGTAPYNGPSEYAMPPGTYTYVVTDANDCADLVTVVIDTTICTGLEEYFLTGQSRGQVKIYPNPNNGRFRITGAGEGFGSIVDQAGQLVKEIKFNEYQEVEVDDLVNGMYFLVTRNWRVKIIIFQN